MKKLLLAALMMACFPSLSHAQQANASSQLLLKFPNGYINPNGSQLNKMVDAINGGLICPSYYFTGATAAAPTTAVDQVFFIATRAMRVISISEIHSVAAGGTSTLQVTKDTGTAAPGAGTDLLSTAFNLNATANTTQTGALVTTAGVVNLAAGNRLAVDFADAIQSSVGVTVTVCLAPLQ